VVRVPLHGRRVRGWVVAHDVVPPPGVTLKPLAKVVGPGPAAELVELAHWAAWRWAGRPASVLRTATTARFGATPAFAHATAARPAAGHRVEVVRMPPASDPRPLLADIAAGVTGTTLVVVPTAADGRGLARPGVVVGTRSAVWATVPDLAAIVVLDEHDEAMQQEQAPTWHARDVAVERARRAGVRCVLASPCPSLEALALADVVTVPSRDEERAWWPVADVVDRRRDDPVKAGLLSERLVRMARDRERGRVLCVLNRKGRAQLLACAACGELARCTLCGASVTQPETGVLRCRRCGAERPVVCASCGATRMRTVRAGVARVRDELQALLGEPVAEVSGPRSEVAGDARVFVGTEALLHQLPAGSSIGVVAFLDLDQELLASRYRAAEQALALLARAARLLGGRARGGRLVLQTRLPHHPVVEAALHADPGRVADDERVRRAELRFPPAAALASVSGPSATAFVEALGQPLGVEVLGPDDGRWLLRAPDHRTLCDALSATPRPSGRLRVEVDPLRI
jgi:primosomal protein N' (replication factor Y)